MSKYPKVPHWQMRLYTIAVLLIQSGCNNWEEVVGSSRKGDEDVLHLITQFNRQNREREKTKSKFRHFLNKLPEGSREEFKAILSLFNKDNSVDFVLSLQSIINGRSLFFKY